VSPVGWRLVSGRGDVVFVGGDEGALVVEDLPAGGGSVPEGGAAS